MAEIVTVHDKNFKIFLSEQKILDRIGHMAQKINDRYDHTEPLFLIILNGAFMFGTELISRYKGHCHVGFVNVRSYQGLQSTGNVQISGLDPETVKEKRVIVVEDIIDSGRTMHKFLPLLKEMAPSSIEIATLLLKPDAAKFEVDVAYSCFEIPDDFVVGFGLDYDGLGRNLRDIYQLAPES